MQEGEFEKKVQQKMEELKFSPSESVWTNVEKEIKKEKKRRLPVFWFFLLLGLVAGGYFLRTTGSAGTENTQVSAGKQASPAADRATNAGLEKPHAKTSADDVVNLREKNIKNNTPSSSTPETNKIKELNKNHTGLISNNNKEKPGAGQQAGVLYKGGVNKINQGKNKRITGPAIVQNAPAPGFVEKDAAGDDKAIIDKDADDKNAESADKTALQNNTTTPDEATAGKTDSSSSKPTAAKKDSAAAKQAVAQQHKKTKKTSPWKIGFTGAAGIGAIHQSLFNPAAVPSPNYDNLLANARYAPYHPSDIKPEFSFLAGAFVQKQLSRKLSFTIGLNYHYYSTSIRTGSKVDNGGGSTQASATYSLQAAPTPYYGNGEMNKYTSRYHFIELPVALQYQLNKSKKWPLFWEAGIAVSRLISTDALYFNYSTGVYYSNNDSFKKTQFSGNTALMIGFSHHKTKFAVGPQLQYGFTNLLNNKTTGKEHLFFTGLKFTIVPNWK